MPKRVLTGNIVSDKGDKTVVVRVERRVKHPLYGKIIRRSKKYHAHDDANEYREGEIVRIEETTPISKLKTWKVVGRVGDDSKPAKSEAKPAAKKSTKATKAKADKAAPESAEA